MADHPQDPNWLTWLASVLGGGGLLGLVYRFFSFVTRAELRQAILDAQVVTDDRHQENLARFASQDEELREIRSAVGRIEGKISR